MQTRLRRFFWGFVLGFACLAPALRGATPAGLEPGEEHGPAAMEPSKAWRLAADFLARQPFATNYAARGGAVGPAPGLPGVFDVEFRELAPFGLTPRGEPITKVYRPGREVSYFGSIEPGKASGYALQNFAVVPPAVHLPSAQQNPDFKAVTGTRIGVRGVLRTRMFGSDEPGSAAPLQEVYYMDTFTVLPAGQEATEGTRGATDIRSLNRHGIVRVDLSSRQCNWMGRFGPDYLRKEIARIEALCTPAPGTKRANVEARFGPGKPSISSKIPPAEPVPESSLQGSYELGTNGTLIVRYDTNGTVQWAHYVDPFSIKGRPHAPGVQSAADNEREERELSDRLRQMSHILAEQQARNSSPHE